MRLGRRIKQGGITVSATGTSATRSEDERSGSRVGDPAPTFILADSEGTQWSPLDYDVAGKPVLILFETDGVAAAAPGLAEILSPTGPLAGKPLTIFHIAPGAPPAGPVPEFPGYSYHRLGDIDGGTFNAYGLAPSRGAALVAVALDPNCRIAGIAAAAPGDSPAGEIAECVEALANERAEGPGSPHAPVLIIPRLLDDAECRRCIDLWQEYDTAHQGAGHSEIAEGCETFLNEYGAMRQYLVEDREPQAWLDSIIAPRVTHEIGKAFETRATKRETYALIRYDADDKGHVRPHRDCGNPETGHRRFTVSVMLNGGDYQGGELRFREYSEELYQLPRGFAVVWSCALLHEVMPVTAGVRYSLAVHLYGN
jgi:hypothetical protein